ncbi:MAG: peptidylprolyl isomerase [Pirellulales bacterium]|nr:peptidylprolyl isomerase [Pirellulales bacterium]
MTVTDSTAKFASSSWIKRWLRLGVGTLLLFSAALVVRWLWQPPAATAQTPAKGEPQKSAAPTKDGRQAAEKPQIVAIVNTEEITREQLGQQCLWHYGREVLEAMVNRRIIEHQCKAQQITISVSEVDAEIDRMAQRFGLPKAQWLKMLESERNIKPAQYAKDIVWPTLALQRLAAARLVVSEQDLHEAWETLYGESVQCRLIACDSHLDAQKVRSLAFMNPSDFGNLAKQFSKDSSSASIKGLIQPIRKHLGNKDIERVAFALKPGEISDIVPVGNQFIVLMCEKRNEARPVPMDLVRPQLTESIRDKKLRLAGEDILKDLQSKCVVDVVYNDPQRRAAEPAVAARVDGDVISLVELAEECVNRHGEELLSGMINRKLLEQTCKKKNIQVSPQEIEAEIALTAFTMGKIGADGKADVEAWMAEVAKQGVTKEMYVHDTAWPNAALKKLAGAKVEVTDIDMQHGFEANFGPRVRCRAIVSNNMRRAQEVWEMACKNPTIEHFSELAGQYSIEASTRSLRGEIPPIQKWGGQPTLEAEAFALKPGEISGVIQVGENYVILFCEGLTEPTKVTMDEVQADIRADIHEKKLRLAMTREFDLIKDASLIDNYLAGTTQTPNTQKVRQTDSLDSVTTRGVPELKAQPQGPRAGSVLDQRPPASGVRPAAATMPPAAAAAPAASKIPTRVNLPRRAGTP